METQKKINGWTIDDRGRNQRLYGWKKQIPEKQFKKLIRDGVGYQYVQFAVVLDLCELFKPIDEFNELIDTFLPDGYYIGDIKYSIISCNPWNNTVRIKVDAIVDDL
jgi:hypothetical protein